MITLLLNEKDCSVRDFIIGKLDGINSLNIAVCYFTDLEIIETCLKKKIKIRLLVALTYPTNPYILKKYLPCPYSKIEIKFSSNKFHSKLSIFQKHGDIKRAIIGSSNYTNGGLQNNIETNILIEDEKVLAKINEHFETVWSSSPHLEPDDLKRYIPIYNKALKNRQKIEGTITSFEKKSIHPRMKTTKKYIIKEGRDYTQFWNCVDEVKNAIVSNIKLPDQPTYLLIDNFWHWVKVLWDHQESSKMKKDSNYRVRMIPKLFKRFLDYDRNNYQWTSALKKRARLFKGLLGPRNIMALTRAQAEELYRNLNSGWGLAQRFGDDSKFAHNNDIKKIRASLNYLLYSNDDIQERISRLIRDEDYKLNHFGKSNVQEIIGWVHDDMPPRNNKASEAIELIGYKFR